MRDQASKIKEQHSANKHASNEIRTHDPCARATQDVPSLPLGSSLALKYQISIIKIVHNKGYQTFQVA
jgi:hypothetical protein